MKIAGLLLAAFAIASGAAAETTPTPTPTPVPRRLSGGFGKKASTPVPASSGEDGQSLGAAVRAASETRQGKPPRDSGVSITNKNLVTDPNRGQLTTFHPAPPKGTSPRPAVPAAAVRPAGSPTPPAAAAAKAPTPAEGAEEAKWQELARSIRQRVADAKERIARLDSEAKKLENDFYAWDDGQYRDNVIKPAWDRKREELESARHDLEEAERDLEELPEKARKAGALPGWIRE